MTLAGRPEQPTPADAEAACAAVRDMTAALVANFRDAVAGISPAEAELRPDPDAWSGREIVAHLIISEYFSHEDLARLATDSEPYPWSTGAQLRTAALAAKALPA